MIRSEKAAVATLLLCTRPFKGKIGRGMESRCTRWVRDPPHCPKHGMPSIGPRIVCSFLEKVRCHLLEHSVLEYFSPLAGLLVCTTALSFKGLATLRIFKVMTFSDLELKVTV